MFLFLWPGTWFSVLRSLRRLAFRNYRLHLRSSQSEKQSSSGCGNVCSGLGEKQSFPGCSRMSEGLILEFRVLDGNCMYFSHVVTMVAEHHDDHE